MTFVYEIFPLMLFNLSSRAQGKTAVSFINIFKDMHYLLLIFYKDVSADLHNYYDLTLGTCDVLLLM